MGASWVYPGSTEMQKAGGPAGKQKSAPHRRRAVLDASLPAEGQQDSSEPVPSWEPLWRGSVAAWAWHQPGSARGLCALLVPGCAPGWRWQGRTSRCGFFFSHHKHLCLKNSTGVIKRGKVYSSISSLTVPQLLFPLFWMGTEERLFGWTVVLWTQLHPASNTGQPYIAQEAKTRRPLHQPIRKP